jgi:hypothetical protein
MFASYRTPLSRKLLVATLLLAFYLTGCGGGTGSPPGPEPDPGPTIQNLLVYQDEVAEGQPVSLYVLNRVGESRRLSEDTDGATVQHHVVSPDGRQVAYWYAESEQVLVLVILALDDPQASPTRLVIEGIQSAAAKEGWLQWLPDSRRVLYTTGGLQNTRYTNSLWLASLGSEQPVQLVAAEPDYDTYLLYSVSPDGSRIAVTVNYWDAQGCCEVASAALYLLDLELMDEPLLIDDTSGTANTIQADWSPTGHELLFQRRMRRMLGGLVDAADGPLMLLGEDGRSKGLWVGDNEPGTRWLDSGRVLVGLNGGFEVIDTDGRVLASQAGTGPRPGTGAGVASVTASPDRKRLAFLAWTTDADLEVYIMDLETDVSQVVGPASSQPIIWHTPGNGYRYDASDLYWSADGSWLAWDWQAEDYLQQSVYAYEVASAGTRLVATGAMFWGFGDYPWLPDGNVLEYRIQAADSGGAFYALEADDLDSGRPFFVAPYPMPPLAVTDSQSGQSLTIVPEYFCSRTWLGNGEVFWSGCDDNTYLSRIAGQTLNDTLLVARGTAWSTLLSNNREIFLLAPASPDTSWQMYDYPRDQLLKLSGTISTSLYTWLM